MHWVNKGGGWRLGEGGRLQVGGPACAKVLYLEWHAPGTERRQCAQREGWKEVSPGRGRDRIVLTLWIIVRIWFSIS